MKFASFRTAMVLASALIATCFTLKPTSAADQTWGTNAGTAWYTATNWAGGAFPGLQGAAASNTDTATFTSAATATTFGINLTTNSLNLGAISVDSTRLITTSVGNSGATAGVLRLYGATVGGTANTILNNASTGLLTLQATQTGTMGLVLSNTTDNIIKNSNTGGITISSIISESVAGNKLTFLGTSSGVLTLSGANTYTGATTVTSGTLSFNTISNVGGAANALGQPLLANATINAAGGLTYTGTGATTDRILNLTGALTLTNSAASGTLTLNGNVTGTGNLSVRGNTANVTLNGIVSTTSVSRTDNGTLTLSNALNSFGTLAVNKGIISINSIGDISVNSAAGAGNSITLGQAGFTNTGTLSFTGASGGSSNRPITIFNTVAANGGIIENTVSGQTLTLSGGVTSTNTGTLVTALLTLQGAGNGLLSGNISQTSPTLPLAITKAGAGTWTLSGSNNYSGGTNINVGTLVIGATNTLLTTGTLTMNSAGSATPVTLDMSGFSQTLGSLLVRNTATTLANADVIDFGSGGNTLTVSGAAGVTFGSTTTSTTTFTTLTGTGTFAVSNAAGVFQVGGAGSGANASTLNMVNLSTFTASLGTGTFRIGDNGGGAAANASGASVVILAQTSTITATKLDLGGASTGSATQTLKLGTIANTINTNNIRMGAEANNSSRSSAEISFQTGAGNLMMRGLAGGVTRVTTFDVINDDNVTGSSFTGLVNLSGHSSDLMIGALTIGKRIMGNTSGGAVGTFTFGTGTFDVTSINISDRTGLGASTGSVTGTLNIGGGTSTIGTITIANYSNTSGAAIGTSSGNLNITSGTATIASITAATYANGGTGTGAATAIINFTGGNISITNDILKGTNNAAATATLNLDGATLDMTAGNIGSGTNIIVLNAKSGTLQNVLQINGGTTGLTKTTVGALTLSGTSSFTNTITVSEGTLFAGSNAPSGSAGAFGNTNSAIALGDAASISGNLNVALLTGGAFSVDRAVTVGSSSTVTLGTYMIGGNTATTSAFTGTITLNQSLSIIQLVGGILNFSGDITTGSAGVKTLTFNNVGAINQGSPSFIGGGSGTIAVVQAGIGTTTFTRANNYTGNTTISAGKLALTGTASIVSSPVIQVGTVANAPANFDVSGLDTQFTLAAGQTLSGYGTVTAGASGLSSPANTTIAPGGSAGTLSIIGTTILAGNYSFEMATTTTGSATLITNGESSPSLAPPGHTNHDVIAINGAATISGLTVNIKSLDSTGFNNTLYYSWKILTATSLTGTPILGTISAETPGTGFEAPGDGRFSLNVVGADLHLNFNPIPEPTVLLGLSALALLAVRRRKS